MSRTLPKRTLPNRWIFFVGALVLWSASAGAQHLPGFQQIGENWTYAVPGKPTLSGILVKPEGNGPFPAVIISHGKGGSVTGFSLPKAREMANWGLVCIGPLYTHGATDPDFTDTTQEGSRPENLRRARACVEILDNLPYVDPARIALYGNSMGAFVSIGLAGDWPGRFKAAAITAGGIVESGDWPAPSVAEADPIGTPFLILHGTADTTVPPDRSARLEQLLLANSVPCERVLYDGVGHDLHQVQSADIYSRIRQWFSDYGLFASSAFPPRTSPAGLYVLDSKSGTPYKTGTLRDANLRTYPFVAGYVLRCAWDVLEPEQDGYDFTLIDNILVKLPVGQKLSLILVPYEPLYIAQKTGVTTWSDVDRDGQPLTRPVPWDPYLRERWRALVQALAAHSVGNSPLRQHPALEVLNAFLPGGHTGIRDPNSTKMSSLPGYTRTGLRTAVIDALRAMTYEFPGKFVQIGFWKLTDSQSSPAAWEEIRQEILEEFNGHDRPQVGFFMENLAASRPAPGEEPVTGYPVTDYGAPLYLSKDRTWTAFQALTSWLAPFTGPEKVANANPADGIRYAWETYGTRYFELYVNDIDNTDWHDDFAAWSEQLQTEPAAATAWPQFE